MNKKIFVRAEEGEPPGISVVYYDTDGNKTIRYLVKDQKQEQWYLKDSAIAMAEDGRLHAIVVHAKTGAYLRPEHGAKSFKELLC